ncbi:DUF1538 domain-containing protein [Desulfobotulus sp.]|uniref:DUF1538 domain-containing protein n=1 Tax=Desulfobotulus sp. TaxID=1940337 RepID=UPI002A35F56F|nr:DUF1538 domain-containing protein [Desulfobotulus sp.]MDY0161911.1 DUF1538 domain-containing protein [Desulfobotulus sp.]
MNQDRKKTMRVKLGLREKMGLLFPYVRKRILEQVQAVALIVVYLVAFQTLVLGIPVAESATVAFGVVVIVAGLAFFMEGLFLGLMPLGDAIGIRLPQKSGLPVILLFAFALGLGVTFAEPAIGILQLAGGFIRPWDAPLLFLLLNKHAEALRHAVGIGVGLAVVLGMGRFMYQVSLKPFLYISISLILLFSLGCLASPNMQHLLGLAWDAGGATTGPVTVPLVLGLGMGICRVVSKGGGEGGGFGVVTLASIIPIYTVLLLGLFFLPSVPGPMAQEAFFSPENRQKAVFLFKDETALKAYALKNANETSQVALWGGKEIMLSYIAALKEDPDLRSRVLGSPSMENLEKWAIRNGSGEQRLAVFENDAAIRRAVFLYAGAMLEPPDTRELLLRNGFSSVQAIFPLSVFLILVLLGWLREKLPRADEIFLGLFFATLGMFLFNVGIELGLSRLGNQVGGTLPASFKRIELVEQTQVLKNFDESLIHTAVGPGGEKSRFFYANLNNAYVQIPYDASRLDRETARYTVVPAKGPLFGDEKHPAGFILVLVFAFFMGYGATLAEPALNALGLTVENLTVGAFRKSLLMQTVAFGVGLGISAGVLKIIWGVPLLYLIGPPYLVLLVLTFFSTEEFVNIGWDSAGVTTGPITVPLVLSLGLGISDQVGGVEGFGILACASVYPIVCVLAVGLGVQMRKNAMMKHAGN